MTSFDIICCVIYPGRTGAQNLDFNIWVSFITTYRSFCKPLRPSSVTRGRAGGGSLTARGLGNHQSPGGTLSAGAQPGWHREVPGGGGGGSRELARPGLGHLQSSHSPGTLGPLHGPSSACPLSPWLSPGPPLGRERSQREARPWGWGPQGPGGLRGSKGLSTLGP